MKKFILSATLLICLLLYTLFPFPAPLRAHAQAGEYACVRHSNTYFYTSKDLKRGLFILPETYYVKVLEAGSDFCKVEYQTDGEYTQTLVGFVRTDALGFVDYTPQTPYFYKLFETVYTTGEGVGGDGFLDEIRLTCAYYGDFEVGSATYCYVLRGGEFGYVPKPESLTVPQNPEYAEWLASKETDTPVSAPQSEEKGASPAQIAIIIALCLLVPVLSALVLRQPKHQPYDED